MAAVCVLLGRVVTE